MNARRSTAERDGGRSHAPTVLLSLATPSGRGRDAAARWRYERQRDVNRQPGARRAGRLDQTPCAVMARCAIARAEGATKGLFREGLQTPLSDARRVFACSVTEQYSTCQFACLCRSRGCRDVTWMRWARLGGHDGEGRPTIHPAKGGRPSGHLHLYRLRPNAKRGGVHRHQQARFRRDVNHGKFANELLETIAPR